MAVNEEKTAEMYLELSKLARHRFDERYDSGLKIVFGICTAFGIAAGFVVGSSEWSPTLSEAIIAAVGSVIIIGIICWWCWQQRIYDEKDVQMTYFWESALESALGTERTKELQPDGWIRFKDPPSKKRPPLQMVHPNMVGQIVVPTLFAALFVLAMFVKAGERPTEGSSVTVKVNDAKTIDLDKVHIDSKTP